MYRCDLSYDGRIFFKTTVRVINVFFTLNNCYRPTENFCPPLWRDCGITALQSGSVARVRFPTRTGNRCLSIVVCLLLSLVVALTFYWPHSGRFILVYLSSVVVHTLCLCLTQGNFCFKTYTLRCWGINNRWINKERIINLGQPYQQYRERWQLCSTSTK